eukprot:770934-Rhodomonas_salina.3
MAYSGPAWPHCDRLAGHSDWHWQAASAMSSESESGSPEPDSVSLRLTRRLRVRVRLGESAGRVPPAGRRWQPQPEPRRVRLGA